MSKLYPKVWSKFERVLPSGRTVHFSIEDISEENWFTVVEFMLGNYIREDVWWATAGTADDVDAIQEYRVLLTSIVKHKMSIGCFLCNGDSRKLVAANVCLPQKQGHFVEHTPPKSQSGLLSLRMFAEAMKVIIQYEKYELDEYLMGAGLFVLPEYRRLGIATELLKTRIVLAKELGFRGTGGIFTGDIAQRSAEKAGMECYYRITYKEFGAQCNITFNTTTEYLKMYFAQIM